MRCLPVAVSILALAAAGCTSFTSSKPSSVVYAAGDKATVGPLVYTVIDTEVAQQLGDDPNNLRTPEERFYLIKVSVTNASSDELEIPSMTLVDDTGHNYAELSDGTGVANWLGVVRKVLPAHTEQGVVAFDAPTKHYRLRLNDALDEKEISIDVPMSFVHERLSVPDSAAGSPGDLPATKK